LGFEVMFEAAGKPDSPLGRALAVAVVASADTTFRGMVRGAIRARARLTRWVETAGGVPQAMAQLSQALGTEPGLTRADVDRDIVDGPILPSSEWASVAEVCALGSSNDREQADRLTRALDAAGADRVEAYL